MLQQRCRANCLPALVSKPSLSKLETCSNKDGKDGSHVLVEECLPFSLQHTSPRS